MLTEICQKCGKEGTPYIVKLKDTKYIKSMCDRYVIHHEYMENPSSAVRVTHHIERLTERDRNERREKGERLGIWVPLKDIYNILGVTEEWGEEQAKAKEQLE